MNTWELKTSRDQKSSAPMCTITSLFTSAEYQPKAGAADAVFRSDGTLDSAALKDVRDEIMAFSVLVYKDGVRQQVGAWMGGSAHIDLNRQLLLQIDETPAFQLNEDCKATSEATACLLTRKIRAIAPEFARGQRAYIAAQVGDTKKVFSLDTSNFKEAYQTCSAYLKQP